MTELFIRGGWAGKRDPRRGQTFSGLPSRSFTGPFFFRFPIGNRHTAYEWAMVLADRHPYSPWFGATHAATAAGMQSREHAVETFSDQANALYRELRTEFKAGRLDPLRREWCTDRPDLLDFTRCVFSLDQVLAIVRRRGDTGWLIGRLLAADHGAARAFGQTARESLRPAPEAEIYKAIQAVYDDAAVAKEKAPNVNEVIKPVQTRLRAAGHQASGRQIRELAGKPQYAVRRRKRGVRMPKAK
jgi:hypothetical protein